jgi:hypothetical protein
MKHAFPTLVVIAFFNVVAFAQGFAKTGAIEFGGNVGFSSTTDIVDESKIGNSIIVFNISPTFGYFVVDGLELGSVDGRLVRTLASGEFSRGDHRKQRPRLRDLLVHEQRALYCPVERPSGQLQLFGRGIASAGR